MIQSIDDADTTGLANLPVDPTTGNPLATLVGGGQNLVSDYSHDPHGRTTQVLGPVHLVDGVATRTAQWTVYDDAAGETRSAVGYAVESTPGSGTFDSFTIVGPVGITRYDADGRVLEQISATPEVTTTADPLASLAAETFSLDEYTAWTAYQYRKTQLVATASYYAIPAVASDPDADGFTGVRGTHYDVHAYGYDSVGRNARVVSPGGTVSQTFFDARGLVLETWLGTDDVPDADHNGDGTIDSGDFRWYVENHGAAPAGTNMVLVSQNEYDHGQAGDGNLTALRDYYDAGSTDYYTTYYQYDWRNRLTGAIGPDAVATLITLDNLSRVTEAHTYASAGYSDGNIVTGAAILLAHEETLYDNRGQVYRTLIHDVDSAAMLATNFWYDPSGRLVKMEMPDGLIYKTAYTAFGAVAAEYVVSDEGSTDALYDDTFVSVTEYVFDSAARHVETRVGTDPGDTRAVSRIWYDDAHDGTGTDQFRVTGVSELKPGTDDVFVLTRYEYDAAGRVDTVIYPDPDGSAGHASSVKSVSTYDALSRVTQVDLLDTATETLLARSRSVYDAEGRLAERTEIEVVDGIEGDTLTTGYWFMTIAIGWSRRQPYPRTAKRSRRRTTM